MRIKDGSISLFELERELKKILPERLKKYNLDIKRMFNHNGLLSEYNYDIAIIEEDGTRDACTVEGFASNFECKNILYILPFKV